MQGGISDQGKLLNQMNEEEKLSALAILEKKQLESVAILKKAIIEESHTDPLRIKGIIGGYYQSLSSTLTIEMIKNGRSEIADKVFTTNIPKHHKIILDNTMMLNIALGKAQIKEDREYFIELTFSVVKNQVKELFEF